MWENELTEMRQVLSDNIKSLRKQRKLAQERLALEAGVDRTLVSKIERKVSNPSLEILVKLALTLQVPVWRLLTSAEKQTTLIARRGGAPSKPLI